MLSSRFLNDFVLGGKTENFEFKMNDDTEVYYSCSSVLNGELFVFGGTTASNNRRKQVKFMPSIYFDIESLYLGFKNYRLRTEADWRS